MLTPEGKKPVTDRQREILSIIYEMTEKTGFPPTVRDLCSAAGVRSTSTMWNLLEGLRKKGCIVRIGGAKSLRITDRGLEEIGQDISVRVPNSSLKGIESLICFAIDEARPSRAKHLLEEALDEVRKFIR